MAEDRLTALFVVEAEAERAATRLRALGIDEGDIVVAPHADEPETREDEVGVPDSAMGVEGLRGDEDAPRATIRMTIGLAHARAPRDELIAVIHAAGGRIV